MMEFTETLSLAHYRIVAGFVDKLGLVEFVDRHLSKTRCHNVSSGQVAKAVILNGLGFVERRLYLFHEFFENLPTERLIGSGIESVHGEYTPYEGTTWEITFGHTKDGRTDLKRFVLDMVTTGDGIPLFLELLSGNESDKKSIVKGLEKAAKILELIGESPLFSVADGAFYTRENIQRIKGAWVSRVKILGCFRVSEWVDDYAKIK